jgi:hypothetical protein
MVSADLADYLVAVIADGGGGRRRRRDGVRRKRVPPRCICFSIVTKVVNGGDWLQWGAALNNAIHGRCKSL